MCSHAKTAQNTSTCHAGPWPKSGSPLPHRMYDKWLSKSCCYFLRFCTLEILLYDLPIHSLSYCKGEDAYFTHLETCMSYLFCRWIHSCSTPAFGNFPFSSAIGCAIEFNVWPCEHALVRPRAFAYVFSFVFLKILLYDTVRRLLILALQPCPCTQCATADW